MEQNKSVSFRIEGSKFYITIDTNKDGQNLIEIVLDLLEVPDEVLKLFKK